MALGESIEKKSTKNYEDCDLSSSRLFNAWPEKDKKSFFVELVELHHRSS
jgi:hypothetical protein